MVKSEGLYGHQVDIDYSLYQLAAIKAFLFLKDVKIMIYLFPDYEEDEMVIDTTTTTTSTASSSISKSKLINHNKNRNE